MAGNVYTKETKTWYFDATGTLNTGGVEIQFIEWIPSTAGHDLVLTDNADNAWLALKAEPGGANAIYRHFNPAIRLPSLKIATIDGGSGTIQFRTDL